MGTGVDKQLGRPTGEVMALVRNPEWAALRKSYRATFTGVLCRLGKHPSEAAVRKWWTGFVLDNTSRRDWMRDGWLSGIDYGDI